MTNRLGSSRFIGATGMLVLASLSGVSSADAQNVGEVAKSAAIPDASEIVVTATRREEPLNKVPISIAAYSQEALDQSGLKNANDIAKLTPGVNFTPSQPRSGFAIDIRGIASTVGTATTGIYIDDTPIQVRAIGYFPSTVYPAVFDLDRVEILRGPQGTLFGAGSEGGTVRFITPSPSLDRFSAYGRAELADTDGGAMSYEAGAAVGGPLIEDKIGFRASVYYRRDGGWVDRINSFTGASVSPNDNYQKTYSARLALSFKPSETLTITPSVFYQNQYTHNSPQYWTTLSDPDKGKYLNGDPLAQPGREKFSLVNVKATYDDDVVNIVGNISRFDRKSYVALDYSTVTTSIFSGGAQDFGFPGFSVKTDERDDQHNWNGELRISPSDANGRFTWLAGLYYEHLRQGAFEGIGGANNDALFQFLTGNPNITSAAVLGAPNVQPGDYAFVGRNNSLDQQLAGFAELSYSVTDALKLTAGARVAHSKVHFTNSQIGPLAGPIPNADIAVKSTPVTPKFSISYQADAKNLFYATAAKGYRIGGGNAALPVASCAATLSNLGLTGAPAGFGSDSLWSYEVGSKNKLFGNVVQVDASAYYIRWRNIQQKVALPCLFQYVDNVASATSKGFDLQLKVRPFKALLLGAAVAYNDAKYTSDGFVGSSNLVTVSEDDKIGNPPWSVTLTGRYEAPLGDHVTAYVYGDYIYHSHNGGTSAQLDPRSVSYDPFVPNLPASHIVDARAGATFGEVDISVFVNNLTNERAELFFLGDVLTNPLFKNSGYRPRTIGLTATFRR